MRPTRTKSWFSRLAKSTGVKQEEFDRIKARYESIAEQADAS